MTHVKRVRLVIMSMFSPQNCLDSPHMTAMTPIFLCRMHPHNADASLYELAECRAQLGKPLEEVVVLLVE